MKFKTNIKDIKIVTFSIFIITLSCNQQTDGEDYQINLQTVKYENKPPYWGMSNIFFNTDDSDKFTIEEDWEEVGFAPLVENENVYPIYVVRYKLKDSLMYKVDLDLDLDFADEENIIFSEGNMSTKFSEFVVNIKFKTRDGTYDNIKTNFQIFIDGRWTYSRVADFRQGVLMINDVNFKIELHTLRRSYPYYDHNSIVLIDFNNNDTLIRQSFVKSDVLHSSEQIKARDPFVLSDNKFIISSLDINGSTLTLNSTEISQAVSKGFLGPHFEARIINNDSIVNLPTQKGITLIEFWSLYCPNSPEAHELMRDFLPNYVDALRYVVVAKEDSKSDILSKIDTFPIKPIIVSSDDAWEIYNNSIITPRFFLIKDGKILFQDNGVGSVASIKQILKDLLN